MNAGTYWGPESGSSLELARVARAGQQGYADVRTPNGERQLEADRILVAAGRRPRIDGLGHRLDGARRDLGGAVPAELETSSCTPTPSAPRRSGP
jgi:pyruvate/2-oxoglutarate dehydrogenase complex dihydrolipoamide dehydrogenase (E3) component